MCVCVCGLQILSFNVVQFNSTVRCEIGTGMDSLPSSIRCKTPFLIDFFLKSEPYVHRPAPKVVREKKRTDPITDIFGSDAMRTGTRFCTAKCQIPVGKPFQSGPQNEQRISLKNPTNEHLRLASVAGTLLKLRLRRNYFCRISS